MPHGLPQDGAEHRVRRPEVIGWRAVPGRLHRIALLSPPPLTPLLTPLAPLPLLPSRLTPLFPLFPLFPLPSYLRLSARDIGMHEAALDRPRPEEGGLHDQVVEGPRLRLRQQAPLPWRLNLEHGQRLAGAHQPHR